MAILSRADRKRRREERKNLRSENRQDRKDVRTAGKNVKKQFNTAENMDKMEEFYEILAYHYVRSDNHKKAYHYLKLSGNKATDKHSSWEAIRFYREAIDILNRLPSTEAPPPLSSFTSLCSFGFMCAILN